MRYIIVDSYGTNQQCWTKKQALEWLAACSPKAAIFCGFTMRRLVTRETVRAY